MSVPDHPRYLMTAPGHPLRGLLAIPMSHAGPVGFIPGHFVQAHLSRKPKDDASEFDARCEVLLTPFVHNVGEMFQIKVMLVDRPGVVQRLLEALALMGVNVDQQESCAVSSGLRGTTHYVKLVGDWTRTVDMGSPIPSWPGDTWVYRSLAHRIPIEDGRYLRLLEQIVASCGEIIVFDRAEGPSLPAICMSPFSYRSAGESSEPHQLLDGDGVDCPPGPGSGHVVTVRLSEPEIDTVCARTRTAPGRPVRYVLSSDAETRTLRALFIPRGRPLVHVGFDHRDERGALAAIGSLVSTAGYNILQSVQRVSSDETSVWELLLEDVGGEGPPLRRGVSELGTSTARLIDALVDLLAELGAEACCEGGAVTPPLDGAAIREVEVRLDEIEERLDAVGVALDGPDHACEVTGQARALADLAETVDLIRGRRPAPRAPVTAPDPAGRAALARARAALSAVQIEALACTLETARRASSPSLVARELLPALDLTIFHPVHPLLRRPLTPRGEDVRGPLDTGAPASGAASLASPADGPHRYRRAIDDASLSRMEDLAGSVRQNADPNRAILLDTVRQRLSQERPALFLSFPGRAATLAEHFATAIEAQGTFIVVQYQQPDNNVIIEQVVEVIRECDFFVGLWYHDGGDASAEDEPLSQWMPFEFGIARALNKPSLVFQSNRIPVALRRRLNGGVATKHFDPETFVALEMHEFVQDISEEWDRYDSDRRR